MGQEEMYVFVKLQNGPNDDDSKNPCLSHWEEKKASIKISHLSFVLDFFPPVDSGIVKLYSRPFKRICILGTAAP